jgi:hypothetical protein
MVVYLSTGQTVELREATAVVQGDMYTTPSDNRDMAFTRDDGLVLAVFKTHAVLGYTTLPPTVTDLGQD